MILAPRQRVKSSLLNASASVCMMGVLALHERPPAVPPKVLHTKVKGFKAVVSENVSGWVCVVSVFVVCVLLCLCLCSSR